jgi:hypothetical protein
MTFEMFNANIADVKWLWLRFSCCLIICFGRFLIDYFRSIFLGLYVRPLRHHVIVAELVK